MVGVNPEIEHSRMANLNTYHDFAQAMEAGKLYHVDLGAQKPGRFDQDLRFGSEDIKETFFVVKLLEDHDWQGTRNFDEHTYRSEDEKGVWDFVEGSMRTYLILWEKVRQFNADTKIQRILREIHGSDPGMEKLMGFYTPEGADQLKKFRFNPESLAKKRLPYEELDQRVQELLMGV
jgi:xylose isomerase